ncbi:uncharacterized protein LOC127851583 [Dreissena polymorpha]|uniref:THD domain-containing protein n=1 Tax=Dreissena polymorpha TaxID=45954 RepID=A0A9D4CVS3_DREPO|nr:uncharacterized protein LOC127851583 [Dreissena polymorpha]KAH3733529.1 hypothetical protein DPMN_039958 [Dreissena polymorpha]
MLRVIGQMFQYLKKFKCFIYLALLIGFLLACLVIIGEYHLETRDVKYEENIAQLADLFDKACADAYDELSKDAMLRAQMESKKYLVYDKLKQGFVTSVPTIKPAARLVGEPIHSLTGRISTNTRDTATVQCWCHECTNAFLRDGVRYHNGRLIVPFAGSYNIYTFLSLRSINYSSEEQESLLNGTLFKQAIYRYDVMSGQDVELVSSVQPLFHANRAFSTPLSRLEQLHVGDEISVKISGIFEEHVCTENSFFGLHMI